VTTPAGPCPYLPCSLGGADCGRWLGWGPPRVIAHGSLPESVRSVSSKGAASHPESDPSHYGRCDPAEWPARRFRVIRNDAGPTRASGRGRGRERHHVRVGVGSVALRRRRTHHRHPLNLDVERTEVTPSSGGARHSVGCGLVVTSIGPRFPYTTRISTRISPFDPTPTAARRRFQVSGTMGADLRGEVASRGSACRATQPVRARAPAGSVSARGQEASVTASASTQWASPGVLGSRSYCR
jgi:hypothetical protein